MKKLITLIGLMLLTVSIFSTDLIFVSSDFNGTYVNVSNSNEFVEVKDGIITQGTFSYDVNKEVLQLLASMFYLDIRTFKDLLSSGSININEVKVIARKQFVERIFTQSETGDKFILEADSGEVIFKQVSK